MTIHFDIQTHACSDQLSHLAIDTSQTYLSLALTIGMQQWTIHQAMPQKQSDHLLAGISALINAAGLSAKAVAGQLAYIAVGQGPGSFVGVRLAMSAAQGLSQAWQCPVRAVDNLALLAWQAAEFEVASPGSLITAAIDARMGQVYTATFQTLEEEGSYRLNCVQPAQVTYPEGLMASSIPSAVDRCYAVGNGFAAYPELMACSMLPVAMVDIVPDAARMGQYLSAHGPSWSPDLPADLSRIAVPNYIRNHVADKPGSAN